MHEFPSIEVQISCLVRNRHHFVATKVRFDLLTYCESKLTCYFVFCATKHSPDSDGVQYNIFPMSIGAID